MTVRPSVPTDLLVHLRRARDRADRHYAEPLDLQALAATARVSKYVQGVELPQPPSKRRTAWRR